MLEIDRFLHVSCLQQWEEANTDAGELQVSKSKSTTIQADYIKPV